MTSDLEYREISDFEFWKGLGDDMALSDSILDRTIRESLFFMQATALYAGVSHYFFEATKALKSRLYIASLLSFLNGIEASLRTACHWLEPSSQDISRVGNFNAGLIRKAGERYGLPIEALRMGNEQSMLELVRRNTAPRIVEIRNHICHGNTTFFHHSMPVPSGESIKIFVPELLKEYTHEIADVSGRWVHALMPAILERRHGQKFRDLDFEIRKDFMVFDISVYKHTMEADRIRLALEKEFGPEKAREIFEKCTIRYGDDDEED